MEENGPWEESWREGGGGNEAERARTAGDVWMWTRHYLDLLCEIESLCRCLETRGMSGESPVLTVHPGLFPTDASLSICTNSQVPSASESFSSRAACGLRGRSEVTSWKGLLPLAPYPGWPLLPLTRALPWALWVLGAENKGMLQPLISAADVCCF